MPKPVTHESLEVLLESFQRADIEAQLRLPKGTYTGKELKALKRAHRELIKASSEEAREIFPPVPEYVADPLKHAISEAARVFAHLPTSRDAKRELVKMVSTLRFNLQVAFAHKSCEEAASRAYALGLMIGRLQAREHEAVTVSGIQSKRGGGKGGRTRDKSDPTWQQTVNAMMKANGRSYTDVCEEIGRRSGVTGRTVKNHTTNPRPKKIRK